MQSWTQLAIVEAGFRPEQSLANNGGPKGDVVWLGPGGLCKYVSVQHFHQI